MRQITKYNLCDIGKNENKGNKEKQLDFLIAFQNIMVQAINDSTEKLINMFINKSEK